MKKKDYIMVALILMGFFIINGFTLHSMKNPLLKEIVRQQEDILKNQKRLESQLSAAKEEDSMAMVNKISMDRRFVKIEKDVGGILGVLKKVFDPRAFEKGPDAGAPPQRDPNAVYDIPVDHSAIIGAKDAAVTIVEFVDFECPFCSRFHTPMAEAAKAFPNDVNYMVKNFPLSFHQNAVSAAKAAFAAGEQGKYAEMVDLLLANGKSLGAEKYKELAKTLGLNIDKFLKDYTEKDSLWEQYIEKDKALANKSGVQGTPTFFINGKNTNARSVDAFKSEIEKLLKEKK